MQQQEANGHKHKKGNAVEEVICMTAGTVVHTGSPIGFVLWVLDTNASQISTSAFHLAANVGSSTRASETAALNLSLQPFRGRNNLVYSGQKQNYIPPSAL